MRLTSGPGKRARSSVVFALRVATPGFTVSSPSSPNLSILDFVTLGHSALAGEGFSANYLCRVTLKFSGASNLGLCCLPSLWPSIGTGVAFFPQLLISCFTLGNDMKRLSWPQIQLLEKLIKLKPTRPILLLLSGTQEHSVVSKVATRFPSERTLVPQGTAKEGATPVTPGVTPSLLAPLLLP